MRLKFKLVKFPSSVDLSRKLSKFGLTPFIERIIAGIKVLSSTKDVILNAQGIIDTGAVFSLKFHYFIVISYE